MRKTLGASRRDILSGAAAMATIFSGCTWAQGGKPDPQSRFKGIGCVLVIDAVPGGDMNGVEFFDDRGYVFFAHSVVSRRNRGILALGGIYVPVSAHVVWRENPRAVRGQQGGISYEGRIVGDYTIPVAERIPDDVLQNIRAHGGSLRLKFRLKPDGVMFGWDIEKGGATSAFEMPGGDFLDTRY